MSDKNEDEMKKNVEDNSDIREDLEDENEVLEDYDEDESMDDDVLEDRLSKLRPKKVISSRKMTFIITVMMIGAIMAIIYFGSSYRKSDFKLPHSKNVSVTYTNAGFRQCAYSLVPLTEDEIMNEHATDIFRGTVNEIKNIKINMNGRKDYQAIADITVKNVLKGEVPTDSTVSILLPTSINTGILVEDTGVISKIKLGMEGIFMVKRYDESSVYETNGATLCQMDLAEFGMGDGERCAFLLSKDGLVYSELTYTDFTKDTTLEEVEQYIRSKLN